MKTKKNSAQKLTSFLIAYFYTLLFTLGMYSKVPVPFNNTFFVFIPPVVLAICYFSFKRFLKNNILLSFIFANILITSCHFHAQYKLIADFSVIYIVLFLLVILVLAAASRFRKVVYSLLLLLALFEWFVLFSWSNDASSVRNNPNKISNKDKFLIKNKNKKPNIILIVLDTFRADYLDLSSQGMTPFLASLAADSSVYENCMSTSSWTLPAHASLFTGLYPTSHGAHHVESNKQPLAEYKTSSEISHLKTYYSLDSENLTMAEILQENGYKTCGVIANRGYLHHTTGMAQGFEIYDDRGIPPFYRTPLAESLLSIPKILPLTRLLSDLSGFSESKLHNQYKIKPFRIAEDINKSAKKLLKNSLSQPFFLFINYMDTHDPYSPPIEYRKKFGGKIKNKWLFQKDVPGKEDLMTQKRKLTKEETEHIHASYQASAMYADAQIGNMLNFLKAFNIYDNSMIIFTSDHGEFLGEHDLMTHTCGLYKEIIHVPLIIKYPGGKQKGTISDNVQLVDVLPTILKFIKIKSPYSIEGRPLMKIQGNNTRKIVSEQYESTVIISKYGSRFLGTDRMLLRFPYKYISHSAREDELFDLINDPGERKNILKEKENIAEKMKKELKEWVDKRKNKNKKKRAVGKMDNEEMRRLKSLGYL